MPKMRGASGADAIAKSTASTGATPPNHDADWEQFQAFVAEVEQTDEQNENESREQDNNGDEAKTHDAEESLENMQYVDRYRKALEHATVPSSGVETGGETQGDKKRSRNDGAGDPEAEQEEEEEEEEDLSSIMRAAAVAAGKRRRLLTTTDGDAITSKSGDVGESDDLEELTNWRSKAI